LVPDERYQTGMPTGATLSLIEYEEAAPPNNHKTPKWARILIGLFVVVLVCVAYLWFFGFQTLIVLEARYLARKTPAVSMAPAQLADFSISRSPGRKLSYFGYEFEVPWNDVDEAKSGLIPDSNKGGLAYERSLPAVVFNSCCVIFARVCYGTAVLRGDCGSTWDNNAL
jgi:hypothetical protein